MKLADAPNIVYFMTDDQDVELGGMTPMSKTRRLLGDQGATAVAAYIATPICAPSRTETLSTFSIFILTSTLKLKLFMTVYQTSTIFGLVPQAGDYIRMC